MKFYLLFIFILLLYCSCHSMQNPLSQYKRDNLYMVYKIDSINLHYLIYCKKDGEKFKIVSKRGIDDSKELMKVVVGGTYNFWLQVFPSENNSNPLLNSPLIVDCYMFEGNTKICREPGINGLFTTSNLKGLFYINKHKKNIGIK